MIGLEERSWVLDGLAFPDNVRLRGWSRFSGQTQLLKTCCEADVVCGYGLAGFTPNLQAMMLAFTPGC